MKKRLALPLIAALFVLGVLSVPSAMGGKPTGGGGGGGGTASNTPIVFVNGYRSWGGAGTGTIKNKFQNAGYTNLSTWSYDSTQNLKTLTPQINDYLAKVKSSTGASSVNGVGHSYGGLVLSKSQVNKFVALGSPFKGTDSAYLCYDPSCYDMRPPGPGGSATACVWSTCDEIINPDSSAQCSGKSCGCVSHSSIDGTQEAWDVSKATVG